MQQCSECDVVALMAPWSGLCWNMWDWPSVSTFRIDRQWQRRHPGPVTRSFHASLQEALFHACQSGVAVSYQDEVDDECYMVPPDPITRAKSLGWVQHADTWSVPSRDGKMHCRLWLSCYEQPGCWLVSSPKGREYCINAGPDEADAVALALLLWDTVLM